jgi:hypothetical protein
MLNTVISVVRNEFGILGCYKKDNTIQNSIGKVKFTSAEGYTIDKMSS